MTTRHVAILTAFSLALFAIDAVIPVIDLLSIPVPRYVGGISLSAGFAFVALGFLVPMAHRAQVRLISRNEAAVCGVLMFWGGMEGLITSTGGVGRMDLILSFIPIVVVAASTRLHLAIFRDTALLVKAFIFVSAGLVATHAVLLIWLRLDVVVPVVNMTEVYQKNGLALLLPVGLWLLTILPVAPWLVFGRVYNWLLALSLLHTGLNHARGALFITAWVLLVGLARRVPGLKRRLTGGLLTFLGTAIVVAMLFAYPFLHYVTGVMPTLLGEGDAATSVLSRSLTNYLLVQKLTADPLLGLGWAEVAGTKAYGYMSHTLYLIVGAGYGVAGVLPVIVLMGWWIRRQEPGRQTLIMHFVFVMVAIASFFNDPFMYYGMMAVFVNRAVLQEAGPEGKGEDRWVSDRC